MRLVDQARLYPARCAVLPQVGGTHPMGYIDTGTTSASGERVYVSVYAAGVLAEALGYKRAGDQSGLKAENARLRARVDQLEADLEMADRKVAAVQVLKQAGFQQTRPVGRPKKQAA